MIERCEGCRHWNSEVDAPPRYYDRGAGSVDVPGRWGTCERIKHLSGDAHGTAPYLEEPTTDPAYLADGSGYFASLTTRSDFGCTLWEGKEADQ